MNKKELEKLKKFLENLADALRDGVKSFDVATLGFYKEIVEGMDGMLLAVKQAISILADIAVIQRKALKELRRQHPKLFWSIPILNALVVASIVTSQLFPGIFSQVLFVFGVVMAGLLTLIAPVVLVYIIRHEETRTPLVFLLAFVAAVIAPVTFFGGLYIWLGLPNSGEAFYFSITTFVTVGFGDEPLLNVGHKVAAALEGFIGYLYLGVLIAAIPRVIDSKTEINKREEKRGSDKR